jgi:L,D-transpeptidase catalytic domain
MPFIYTVAAAFVALFAVAGPANASVLVSIDKSTQRMTVSVDGEHRYTWPVSTGRAGYATPSGSFRAFRMEEDHYSKEWDDAPMPHSIFFTGEGHAIHGSYETKRLGTPASHGCVRLSPAHAATLFALVKEEGLSSTKVVLTGNPPATGPAVAQRKPRRIARTRDAETTGYADRYAPYGRPIYGQPVYGRPVYGPQPYTDGYAPRYEMQPRAPFPFFN